MADHEFPPVEDPGVFRPDDDAFRAFISDKGGFVHLDDVTESPMTDAEIAAQAKDDEYWRSFATTPDAARDRIGDNSPYTFNARTREWGAYPMSLHRPPHRIDNSVTYAELMALVEIAETEQPRFLGGLILAQSARLGLITPAGKPNRDPGFLHRWSVKGKDTQTGLLRVDHLNRDSYQRYFGEAYPPVSD